MRQNASGSQGEIGSRALRVGEQTPEGVLREVFGFDDFRGSQRSVVEHVAAGGDAVVLMPTGGGKSLCYQLPALLRPGLGVVVSPLIALMKDQVDALRQLGVAAAALNSRLSPAEAAATERAVGEGALDLLYVSPERLMTPRCLALLRRTRHGAVRDRRGALHLAMGSRFPPRIPAAVDPQGALPGHPADGAYRDRGRARPARDIVAQLPLDRRAVFVAGYDRPNLFYRIVPKRSPLDQLGRFLAARHPGNAGIVYCFTRKAAEETAGWLSARAGATALPYHAGLEPAVRERTPGPLPA